MGTVTPARLRGRSVSPQTRQFANKQTTVFQMAAAFLILSGCGGGGSSGGASPVTSAPPPAPQGTATARFDAPSSVMAYSPVLLDGTLSRDTTLAIASYAWTQTAGPTVTLTDASTAQASFTAPQVSSTSTLTFQLTVTDSKGGASTYSGNVSVYPASTAQLVPAFIALRFLSAVNDNMHNDAVPIDGPPLMGGSAIIQATLSGVVVNPTFTLVDANGKTLGPLTISTSGSGSVQPIDFAGILTVPTVPFRVLAAGTTADGQKYSLTSPRLVTPMNMTVAFAPSNLTLAPGASGATQLNIYNGGAAASFTVQFTDPSGLLANDANVTVQVAEGQSAAVPVTVTFPATLKNVFAPKLTATASVTGDPTRMGATTLPVWLDGSP